MQLVRSFRARRSGVLFLACVVTGLVGCGGGGGAHSAFAPPRVLPAAPPGLTASAQALINDLTQGGADWVGMVEADSGGFPLTGENPDANDILNKLPDPNLVSTSIIPTEYSRFAYFRSTLSSVRDPGRYLLWGGLAETPATTPLNYTMQGVWTCSGCGGDDAAGTQRRASGTLRITPDTEQGRLTLGGNGLDLDAALSLEKSGALTADGTASLTYNGRPVDVQATQIRGALFGPEAEEAGVLFGVSDESRIFTGTALGTRSPGG